MVASCYNRDQTWLCVYYWCQTPEGVVSPLQGITRARQHRASTQITTRATPSRIWHQQYTHNHVWSLKPFIQTQIKENIKAPRHWPLCGEFKNNLAKIYSGRYNIDADNFKLKLCACAQSMALSTHTKFQLEILIRSAILVIYKFRDNILESSRNASETPLGPFLQDYDMDE